MDELISTVIGIIIIIVGLLVSFGIVRLAPGYAKVAGFPVGIFMIVLGAKIAGWV